ncbi:unnamed protein product, partial [Heterosigma akashiwo]
RGHWRGGRGSSPLHGSPLREGLGMGGCDCARLSWVGCWSPNQLNSAADKLFGGFVHDLSAGWRKSTTHHFKMFTFDLTWIYTLLHHHEKAPASFFNIIKL